MCIRDRDTESGAHFLSRIIRAGDGLCGFGIEVDMEKGAQGELYRLAKRLENLSTEAEKKKEMERRLLEALNADAPVDQQVLEAIRLVAETTGIRLSDNATKMISGATSVVVTTPEKTPTKKIT